VGDTLVTSTSEGGRLAVPLIIAHRGASGYAPENTFAAFELAIDMHAHGIETDIRASSDGVLVLVHDERIDRTCQGSGRVADLTISELDQMDAGSKFDPKFSAERVPRLSDFLESYASRTRLWLELKAAGVARGTVALLRRYRPARGVEFSSFQLAYLEELRAAWPEAATAFLTRDVDGATIAACKDLGVGTIGLPPTALTSESLDLIRGAGLLPRGWGINTRAELELALSCNLASLTLNWPDWALAPRGPEEEER
jgi:glycerophosphoryl diester phosphodiesterase